MSEQRMWTRRRMLAGCAAVLGAPLAANAQGQPADPNAGRFQVDTITLTTKRQPMKVSYTRLKFPGRRPVVVLLPEKPGPTPAFEAVARRLAQEGLLAAMPDIPSAWGVGPEAPQDARDAYGKAPAGEITALIDQVADQMARVPESNGSVGLLAFQWGAQMALPVLLDKARLKAAVLFDVVMDRPERWQGVAVPMQMHIPDQDQAAIGGADNIEKKFLAQGRIYEQYYYPGMLGGFALDPASPRYNKDAADLAFERAAKYLRKKLLF